MRYGHSVSIVIHTLGLWGAIMYPSIRFASRGYLWPMGGPKVPTYLQVLVYCHGCHGCHGCHAAMCCHGRRSITGGS